MKKRIELSDVKLKKSNKGQIKSYGDIKYSIKNNLSAFDRSNKCIEQKWKLNAIFTVQIIYKETKQCMTDLLNIMMNKTNWN